jgi:hypothetical protein
MEHLQQVNISVYSDADCQSVHFYTVHDTNICAGVPAGGKGQCSVSTSNLNITISLLWTEQTTGDSRYTQVLRSCESQRRLYRKRVQRETKNGRGFSECYTMRGLNLLSSESKWWGESVKLRAQLSGPAQPLLPSPRIGYWFSSWFWNKIADTRKRGNRKRI